MILSSHLSPLARPRARFADASGLSRFSARAPEGALRLLFAGLLAGSLVMLGGCDPKKGGGAERGPEATNDGGREDAGHNDDGHNDDGLEDGGNHDARDNDGGSTDGGDQDAGTGAGDLAPPPLSNTEATSFTDSISFLYSGNNPSQTGVAPGTITAARVAVLRGTVLDAAGQPIPGVQLSVLDHPELGQTLSRSDGQFDLAVNGGGTLTLRYEKSGLLPVQRTSNTPWQEFLMMPDVVMLQLDPAVTSLTLGGSALQIARGSNVSDADGARQPTVLVPGGTVATMVLADGSEQPLTTMDLRVTEYTVGANGPKAMPAVLPPSSGYTYAAEFSVDQALAAGAVEVKFNQALPVYIDNFLDFPTGTPVPAGYYNRQQGQWVAEESGLVIKVLAVAGGVASLDVTGDGAEDTGTALTDLGITTAELQQLATTYAVGKTLWRVPLTHFSSWDFNWPFGPPPNAVPPHLLNPNPNVIPNKRCGSIIGCENQSLGEVIDLTGSGLRLHYNSDQVSKAANTIDIPLSDSSLPSSVTGIQLAISVAGRRFTQYYSAASNLSYHFVFDGKDAYGREVFGRQKVSVAIGYVYKGVYEKTTRFGYKGNGLAISGDRERAEVVLWLNYDTIIGSVRDSTLNAAGWSLSAHHVYSPESRELLLGSGERRWASQSAIGTIAGNGTRLTYSDLVETGPALTTKINEPSEVVAGPDGSIYFLDQTEKVKRLSPAGVISVVAGRNNQSGQDNYAEGVVATLADMSPRSITLGPDGLIYLTDAWHNLVRRVNRDGTIQTVAGKIPVKDMYGQWQSGGDGGLALQAQLRYPEDVVVAPDGTLYFSEENRIRRVGTDGIITTVVGNGTSGGNCGVGDPTAVGVSPRKLALGRDGSLYYTVRDTSICRMNPAGKVTIITGETGENYGLAGVALVDGAKADHVVWYAGQYVNINDIAVAADGSLLLVSQGLARVFRIDTDGIITRIAGSSQSPYQNRPSDQGFMGDGGPARDSKLGGPLTIALAADGTLIIGDTTNYRIRQVKVGTPAVRPATDSKYLIAAQDGSEIYLFDDKGRHLTTREALTGAVRYSFAYDTDGYLSSITDGANNTTLIERSAQVPTAIIAPGGQRTSLSVASKQLKSVTNPASEAHTMTYGADGLLASYTLPGGGAYQFTYDGDGYLLTDSDPEGGSVTLARTKSLTGYTVTATTAQGRVHTYKVETLSTGELRSTVTEPSGAVTVRSIYLGGNETVTYPNGSTRVSEYAPDPRWGMAAPYARRVEVTSLGGRMRTLTMSRAVALSDAEDPWSLTAFEELRTENSQTRALHYSAATGDVTITSPEGRVYSATLDALGRRVIYSPGAGITPIERVYDSAGRLSVLRQGTSETTFTYDALNRLTQMSDGSAQPTSYEYDLADRVTKLTLPSGRFYRFSYNGNGQTTQVTMPNGKVHSLGFDTTGMETNYTPPDSGGSLSWSYNLDGAWTGSTLLDGSTLSASYDTGGRPIGRAYASGTATYGYAGTTARVSSIGKTPTAGTAQQISLSYDAELVTAMSWSGVASANFTYDYDSHALPSSISLASGSDNAQITTTYDDDGLITQRGPFAYLRGGPMGSVSHISDSAFALDVSLDDSGRTAQRSVKVAAATRYSADVLYDDVGRVSSRTETVAGTTRTIDYAYDADGQLTDVWHDDALVEHYGYDSNGNRSTPSATYDSQDRMLTLGATNYAFGEAGFLAARGSDRFDYSARGELLSATVGGQSVSYSYDGLGRRVGRKVGAAASGDEYLYGNPENPLQLSAARTPAGTLQLFHYDHRGLLIAIQQGATYYYVATDEIGTPRVVTDASGTVVKLLDYDAYGVLKSDSAPAFALPIGFAGGLADQITGLVRFGFRDYEPASGRWLARDPALYDGLQLNLYSYVGNNPVGRIDPAGLFTFGGSAYAGPGGGFKFTVDSTGFVVCGELGFGAGASVEIDPFEDVGDVDVKPALLGEVGLGPFGAGIDVSGVGDCFSVNPSIKLGPIKGKFEGITTADPAGVDFTNFDLPLHAEAKVAGQVCGGMKF